jgi:DNA-binding transcriptional LysR family regulator
MNDAGSRETVMSDPRIDFNLMNVFQAVMVERNVTRAAHRLAMTQPAVSNALRRLRAMIADELFIKIPGGVEPTERAKMLWAELEAPLAQIRQAVSPGRFDPSVTTRIFNVAITETLTARVVPVLATRFAKSAPAARLRFLPHANPTSIAGLERGELDCAVGMFPHPPPTLQVEGLMSDDYVCAFAADHPVLEAPLSLAAFAVARHVLVRQGPTGIGIVDDWLSLKGLSRRIVLILNSCADALAAVAASDLVTAVPASFIKAHGRGLKLAISPLPFDSQKILYKLAWHERSEHDPGRRWFRRLVAEVVRAQ